MASEIIETETSPSFVFPFPSNGKPHRKSFSTKWPTLTYGRFHSLQTGNRSTSPGTSYLAIVSPLFPFPSNGKAHRKLDGWHRYRAAKELFPFPSNGKAHRKGVLLL